MLAEYENELRMVLIAYLMTGSYVCGRLTPFRLAVKERAGRRAYALMTSICLVLWPAVLVGLERAHVKIFGRSSSNADKPQDRS